MSLSSKTGICNRALVKLGCNPATNIETDDTKESRTLNGMYDYIRDAELQAHTWNFSKKRVILSPLVAAPDFEYEYYYQLPSDFLSIFYIVNDPEYEIEGDKILTDSGDELQLVYIARITDTTLFSSLFVEALACQLALESCETITQSNTKYQLLFEKYKETIVLAKRANAITLHTRGKAESEWLEARL